MSSGSINDQYTSFCPGEVPKFPPSEFYASRNEIVHLIYGKMNQKLDASKLIQI